MATTLVGIIIFCDNTADLETVRGQVVTMINQSPSKFVYYDTELVTGTTHPFALLGGTGGAQYSTSMGNQQLNQTVNPSAGLYVGPATSTAGLPSGGYIARVYFRNKADADTFVAALSL